MGPKQTVSFGGSGGERIAVAKYHRQLTQLSTGACPRRLAPSENKSITEEATLNLTLSRPLIPRSNHAHRCLIAFLVLFTVVASVQLVHGQAGSLDTTFHSNGKTVTDFTNLCQNCTTAAVDQGFGIAIDSQNRIVLAGTSTFDASLAEFSLARYATTGALDSAFNGIGQRLTTFSGDDYATAATLDDQGRIVAVGVVRQPGLFRFGLARFTSGGALDANFGSQGHVTTSFNDLGYPSANANAVAIDSNHHIVVAGFVATGFFGNGVNDVGIARYNDDGTLDTTFGTGGRVVTDIGSTSDGANAVAIDGTGRIVIAGFTNNNPNGAFSVVLARYDAFGNLDTTFGTGGVVQTSLGGPENLAEALVIDGNGRIVIAGFADPGNVVNFQFALARYNTVGALDSSFGTNGIVLTDMTANPDMGFAIAIDSRDRIVAAGNSGNNQASSFALARYKDDGTLDTHFGNSGKVFTDFSGAGTSVDVARGVAIDGLGRIVAGGTSKSAATNFDFAVARYISDDFNFSAITPINVALGGSGSFNVTVNSLDLFDSTVNLSVSGQPNGMSGAFVPTSVTPAAGGSASSSLNITVGPAVTANTYNLTVTGSAPAVTHTAQASVKVVPSADGTSGVVGTLQAAGCIDNGSSIALTSKLNAAQADIAKGNNKAAVNDLNSALNQINAQAGRQIATTCTVNGVTFNPVAVLIADIQALLATL